MIIHTVSISVRISSMVTAVSKSTSINSSSIMINISGQLRVSCVFALC